LKNADFTQRAQGRQDLTEVRRFLEGRRKKVFFMQVLGKRAKKTYLSKNSASISSPLRALRPLRETHSVSPPEHFPTTNSEEPEFYQERRCNGSL
jgi:hypothetical protein